MLYKYEQMTAGPQDILEYHKHLEGLTQRLVDTHARIERSWQVTQGLLKNTKDAHRQRIALDKQSTLKMEEATFNADLSWVKEEQAWLAVQPAFKALLANIKENVTQTKSGTLMSKAELQEDEETLSFEELLEQMKKEEQEMGTGR